MTYTTLSGNVITANESMTNCYFWPNGNEEEKIRIKKREYEQVVREDQLLRGKNA